LFSVLYRYHCSPPPFTSAHRLSAALHACPAQQIDLHSELARELNFVVAAGNFAVAVERSEQLAVDASARSPHLRPAGSAPAWAGLLDRRPDSAAAYLEVPAQPRTPANARQSDETVGHTAAGAPGTDAAVLESLWRDWHWGKPPPEPDMPWIPGGNRVRVPVRLCSRCT
jgi:hypothetical protein